MTKVFSNPFIYNKETLLKIDFDFNFGFVYKSLDKTLLEMYQDKKEFLSILKQSYILNEIWKKLVYHTFKNLWAYNFFHQNLYYENNVIYGIEQMRTEIKNFLFNSNILEFPIINFTLSCTTFFQGFHDFDDEDILLLKSKNDENLINETKNIYRKNDLFGKEEVMEFFKSLMNAITNKKEMNNFVKQKLDLLSEYYKDKDTENFDWLHINSFINVFFDENFNAYRDLITSYNNNLSKEDINKFIEDIDESLFISIFSGFEYIANQLPIKYKASIYAEVLRQVDYSLEKMKMEFLQGKEQYYFLPENKFFARNKTNIDTTNSLNTCYWTQNNQKVLFNFFENNNYINIPIDEFINNFGKVFSSIEWLGKKRELEYIFRHFRKPLKNNTSQTKDNQYLEILSTRNHKAFIKSYFSWKGKPIDLNNPNSIDKQENPSNSISISEKLKSLFQEMEKNKKSSHNYYPNYYP